MDLNNLNHKSMRKSNKRTGDILKACSVLKKCLADMYIRASEKKNEFYFRFVLWKIDERLSKYQLLIVTRGSFA